MTGSLFDPSKMAAQRALEARPAAPGPPATFTVSALAGAIDAALRTGLPGPVRVIGEVSGMRDRTHWYFDLKDANASISCVMFASAARRVRWTPADGQEVVVSGRVEFYPRQGRVSLIADSVQPVGDGALDLAYRRLVEQLRALGYFDPARKRPVPVFPRRVAVVTSRSAAALQDVLVTMRRRCPAVSVLLADVRVQGDGAAADVAGAIDTVSRHHERLGVDALLVTRGGGSKEDLWTFNERVVADAIVRCRVPVVAAIGHESDTTIAELVADARCATPTQAAVCLTPDGAALERQLASAGRRLWLAVKAGARAHGHAITHAARDLGGALAGVRHRAALLAERAAARLDRQRPHAVLARLRARLDAAALRIGAEVRRALEAPDLDGPARRLGSAGASVVAALAEKVGARELRLQAVSPLRVLERGYSVTTGRDGRLVRSVSDVRPRDRLRTRVSDGTIDSRAEESQPPSGGDEAARADGRAVRRRGAQPGLFGGADA